MPILSQLICKWHIKNADIRKKVLTGYEESKEEKQENLKQLNNIKNDWNNGYRQK